MEIDSHEAQRKSFKNYTDQRYGMVLTGSSKAAPEYIKFKSGLLDVGQVQHGKGISLAEYLKNSITTKQEPI